MCGLVEWIGACMYTTLHLLEQQHSLLQAVVHQGDGPVHLSTSNS
jgi:hypothetical protein